MGICTVPNSDLISNWRSIKQPCSKYIIVLIRMVLNHFSRYPLGLVSIYLRTYHRTEEFIMVLANHFVSEGVRIAYGTDIFL